jgi:hypothetical protein
MFAMVTRLTVHGNLTQHKNCYKQSCGIMKEVVKVCMLYTINSARRNSNIGVSNSRRTDVSKRAIPKISKVLM